jgi:hypothetical protein
MAYAGGSSFMARLQALSDAKAEYDAAKVQHDAALVELRLGMAAKAAHVEAESNRAATAAEYSQAEAVLKQAKVDAEGIEKVAQAQAAAIVAEAQQIHDAATAIKASADATLAAARAKRQDLQAKCDAADRREMSAGWKETALQRKIDYLHARIDEILASDAPASITVQLAS